MTCPICDQKPINCDCTEAERRQFCEIQDLEAEIDRLRLTDEERQAIDRQADWLARKAQEAGDIHSADLRLQEAATLRGLLERTK